jgi:hypothetical protein
MSWARLDDRLSTHPKLLSVWQSTPGALGLYFLSISHASCHETDGHIDPTFVAQMVPNGMRRNVFVRALVEGGLWRPTLTGWEIHDFLDYNPSHAQREEERALKAEAGRKGAEARWHSDGTVPSSGNGSQPWSRNAPVPSRPETRPGKKERDARTACSSSEPLGFDEWLTYHAERSGRRMPRAATAHRRKLAGFFADLLAEGWELTDFRFATDGVINDKWKVEHGHDKFESVLRKTKFGDLVEDGRRPRPQASKNGGGAPSQLRRIKPQAFDQQEMHT